MFARLGLVAILIGTALPASANRPNETGQVLAPVHCVAVFELMSRAEPRWMRQIDVQIARRSWQLEAGATARQLNIDLGLKVNQALESMGHDIAAENGDLTVMASQCVAEAPL